MGTPLIPLNSEIDCINDVENVAKTTFQYCHDMIKDVITHSSDSSSDLTRLKSYMTTISESQRELAGLIHAVNEISNLTGRVNLEKEEATAKFQEVLDEFVEENDIDIDQKNVLFSLNSFLTEELQSGSQKEDSDLLVTKATISYKDPLSQRIMQDPVKCKLCHHSYERESIMVYLSDSKKKCPYSGCKSILSKNDLIDDFMLKFKLSMKTDVD